MSSSRSAHLWWQRGVIYQVYPRSFLDRNGDGIGDLRGIEERLEYLEWLGVDAVWISPFFRSPMADFGYDVSDYRDVEPMFGTLEDAERLIEAVHDHGMRVIFDFVPNHTSDRHPWFEESRASRDSPKRDWYLWHDPGPDGGPPNNWHSVFGGSAWELDEATGQYYYHAFLPQQPDLNWRNAEVQQAMFDVMRFWLDRGVDGFRVDVIWHLVKDEELRDNPEDPSAAPDAPEHEQQLREYSEHRPEVHDVIAKMRGVVDEYPERVLIGEIYLPLEQLVTYYGEPGGGVHLPANFQLLLLPWEASEVREAIERYEAAIPEAEWPNWVLGNHDRPRVATRIGAEQARVAAMLLLTLRGTPTIYYGDEIGMENVPIPPDRVQDPYELRVPDRGHGRDPQRTPMQWDASRHAGFTSGEPWLPLSEDHATRNVEQQRDDPRSMLTLHRRLLALRRAEAALSVGSYQAVPAGADDLLAYERESGGSRFLVVLNMGGEARRFESAPGAAVTGRVELSTHLDREGERYEGALDLRPDEGVVVRLDAAGASEGGSR